MDFAFLTVVTLTALLFALGDALPLAGSLAMFAALAALYLVGGR